MVFKSSNSPNSNFMYGKIGHSLGSKYHVEKKRKLIPKKKKKKNLKINYDKVLVLAIFG